MITVLFVRPFRGWRVGEEFAVQSEVANCWISQGLAVDAVRWKASLQQAVATDYRTFAATEISGLRLGDAYLKFVVQDPRVQAFGRLLCTAYPSLTPVFAEGVFPDGLHQHRWPLFLDAVRLAKLLVDMALNRIERYVIKLEADDTQDVVEETFLDVFRDTAHAILDRHGSFFALLRHEKVVGSGVTRTGQPVPEIPGSQWSRADRWFDIRSSDILDIEGESETIMWKGISLSASAAEGEASPPQVPSERAESTAARGRRNTHKISRQAVIAKMLKAGVRPGRNWRWKKFCDAVRDAANGWDHRSGKFNRGFSDRSITRDTLALMRLLDK